MKIINCEQRSAEWYQVRLGIPSSSCFDKIVTTTGKLSKQSEAYIYQLATERITGQPTESYQSQAMHEGTEREDKARLMFELENDIQVQQVGFCLSDNATYGCSPDGLMDHAGLEIKCPKAKTHCKYLLDPDSAIEDYFQQLQGSMLVTGFSSYWFMSYYPDMPALYKKVQRDDKFCAILKVSLDEFCQQLDEVTNKLRGLN